MWLVCSYSSLNFRTLQCYFGLLGISGGIFFGLLEITRGNKRWFPKLDSWVSLCWGAESQAHRVQEASLARQAVVRVEISPTGPSLSSLPPSLCFSLGVSSGEDLSSLGSQRFPGWTACYCWISLAGAPAPALSLR